MAQAILDDVGSDGRPLGRIGDGLEVILDHVKMEGLQPAEPDALAVLRGQLAEIRKVKDRARPK